MTTIRAQIGIFVVMFCLSGMCHAYDAIFVRLVNAEAGDPIQNAEVKAKFKSSSQQEVERVLTYSSWQRKYSCGIEGFLHQTVSIQIKFPDENFRLLQVVPDFFVDSVKTYEFSARAAKYPDKYAEIKVSESSARFRQGQYVSALASIDEAIVAKGGPSTYSAKASLLHRLSQGDVNKAKTYDDLKRAFYPDPFPNSTPSDPEKQKSYDDFITKEYDALIELLNNDDLDERFKQFSLLFRIGRDLNEVAGTNAGMRRAATTAFLNAHESLQSAELKKVSMDEKELVRFMTEWLSALEAEFQHTPKHKIDYSKVPHNLISHWNKLADLIRLHKKSFMRDAPKRYNAAAAHIVKITGLKL